MHGVFEDSSIWISLDIIYLCATYIRLYKIWTAHIISFNDSNAAKTNMHVQTTWIELWDSLHHALHYYQDNEIWQHADSEHLTNENPYIPVLSATEYLEQDYRLAVECLKEIKRMEQVNATTCTLYDMLFPAQLVDALNLFVENDIEVRDKLF